MDLREFQASQSYVVRLFPLPTRTSRASERFVNFFFFFKLMFLSGWIRMCARASVLGGQKRASDVLSLFLSGTVFFTPQFTPGSCFLS